MPAPLFALLVSDHEQAPLSPLLISNHKLLPDLGASRVVPPGPPGCYLTGESRPPGGVYVKLEGASPGPGEREEEEEDEEFAPTQPPFPRPGME